MIMFRPYFVSKAGFFCAFVVVVVVVVFWFFVFSLFTVRVRVTSALCVIASSVG